MTLDSVRRACRLPARRLGALAGVILVSGLAGAATVRAADAGADAEPLVSDRPSLGDTALVVPRSSFQVEGGVTLGRDGDVDSLAAGELLLRYGFRRAFEGVLGPGSYRSLDAPGASASGHDDTLIGARLQLRRAAGKEPDGRGPDIAMLVGSYAPTGSGGFGQSGWQPQVRLSAAWGISTRVSLAANANYGYLKDGADRTSEWAAGSSVGIALSPRVSAYGEVFGFYAQEGRSDRNRHFVDAGVLWLVRDRLQIDGRVGTEIDARGSAEEFLGFGITFRTP